MMTCTLCENTALAPIYANGDKRSYYHCERCSLIFVDPGYHLSRKRERDRYKLHNNGIEHSGYVKFLNRIIQPCLSFLSVEMECLDYGCGPVPTLSKLLNELNFRCFNYDPLFGFEHPNHMYDFIFASECFEHFYYPQKDISIIDNLLKPGGYLGVMTERWEDLDRFKTWYYKRDPTQLASFTKRVSTSSARNSNTK